MFYYSTKNSKVRVDFREATIMGQASDKGLFFPEQIPALPKGFIKDIEKLSKEEIALQVIQPYVGNTIEKTNLEEIIAHTINFDFPLQMINDTIYALELFHGPTLAFKDVGARFMSRCLNYFVKDENKQFVVLVATSGDTGGAVANGFYDVEGVQVVILYPSEKVSYVQEKQLTALGRNIKAIEVEGSFDDCQRMVKQAFTDVDINKKLSLTSANSINIARWLPQQFYYFFGYQQWHDKEHPPVVSVPSGNFGNLCAGLMAWRSGLPVDHFIAACNDNATIANYLEKGDYIPGDTIHTLSNAMDVSDPSNFVRIMELFQHQLPAIRNTVTAYSINDEDTAASIDKLYHQYAYLSDPHGAVGFTALEHYLLHHPDKKGFFLETAHPVKFENVVEPLIKTKIAIPEGLNHLLQQKKESIKIKVDDTALKSLLLSL